MKIERPGGQIPTSRWGCGGPCSHGVSARSMAWP